ncbi:hypothetical protein CTZ27_35745 [Streptomyces griseocarneus]|nr:hypothetical protein CTZ27_35745 [Streptomyces griseocarneus]
MRHDTAMREEPLEDWARRREERRAQSMGKLRAVPLTSDPHRGAHVEPTAPRVIQEWTGSEWATVGVVPDLAAAKAVLYPRQPAEERPAEWDRPVMGKGRGRHRRPSAALGGRRTGPLNPRLEATRS